MSAHLAWVQGRGEVVPLDQVTVPAHAPAVLFGESVFETFRADQGRIFRLNAHFERMAAALQDVGWGEPPSFEAVRQGLRALLVAADRAQPLRVRLTVLNLGERTECMISAVPYAPPAADAVTLCVTEVSIDPSSLAARHKTGNRLAHRMAHAQAQRAGAFDGLLRTPKGCVADGAISTVFIVSKGTLYTPALSCGALPGITRRSVLELAQRIGLHVREECVNPEAIRAADEVFCTNALVGVLPVCAVDGEAVRGSVPGPVTRQLTREYRRWVDENAAAP